MLTASKDRALDVLIAAKICHTKFDSQVLSAKLGDSLIPLGAVGQNYGHMFRELLTAVDSWEDGTACIWTVETGECAAKLEGHTGPAP